MPGPYGYNGRVLHIDLSAQRSWVSEPGDIVYRRYAGGGLLAAYFLLQETEPGLDAFDPANLLGFYSSVVAGAAAPGLARFTVAAKSPLTGGIGEARSEGPWGVALKASGYDAVLFSGRSTRPTVVVLHRGQPQFLPAESLWGRPVDETTDELLARLGSDALVAAIGPAGEQLVRYASVVTDYSHQAARGGMGAVMGSKNLKAVVLVGGEVPPPADAAVLTRISRAFSERIRQNELSEWQLDPPGFACWVHTHGLDAALCVNNYQTAEFTGADAYRPSVFMEYFRGAKPCPHCANECIKLFTVSEADGTLSGGMHQEVTGALGPNVNLRTLEPVIQLNQYCNQMGLDPDSLGYVVSFALECAEKNIIEPTLRGIALRFGSHEAVRALVGSIVCREGVGAVLAEGVKRAAERFGGEAPSLAMHVKGCELVPFEPRSQTNLALGYALSPTGPRYEICEHDWDFDTEFGWEHSLEYTRTLGILERISMGYLGPDKVRNFRALNNLWSAFDALGICIFSAAPTRVLSLRDTADIVAGVTGWETSDYEIMRWGERRNHLLRIYNLREGLTPHDDTLPERFFTEPIDSGGQRGAFLDRQRFSEAVRMYYEMMGWDDNGRPGAGVLYDHGLEWVL